MVIEENGHPVAAGNNDTRGGDQGRRHEWVDGEQRPRTSCCERDLHESR